MEKSGNKTTKEVLNTLTLSIDMMTLNSTPMRTRYDAKSSKSGLTIVGTTGGKKNLATNKNDHVVAPIATTVPSSKKDKLKRYFLSKLFPDDTYSVGSGHDSSSRDEKAGELDPEESKQERWSGQFQFTLSCLSSVMWRFPYLCYKNGGGAFLIPYLIFLFLAGIPLFYIEVNLGQYTSQGPISCWKMAPIFKGLGISMNIISFYYCIYYNMILAYSLYYLVNSFDIQLPWTKCDWAWASLSQSV